MKNTLKIWLTISIFLSGTLFVNGQNSISEHKLDSIIQVCIAKIDAEETSHAHPWSQWTKLTLPNINCCVHQLAIVCNADTHCSKEKPVKVTHVKRKIPGSNNWQLDALKCEVKVPCSDKHALELDEANCTNAF